MVFFMVIKYWVATQDNTHIPDILVFSYIVRNTKLFSPIATKCFITMKR